MKKNKKRKRKIKLWKEILKNIIAFIVGLLYIIYNIIKYINNLIANIFLKLPRIIKIIIIYIMIILSIFGIKKPKQIIKEVTKEEEIIIKLDAPYKKESIEEKPEEKNICNLSEIECKIFNTAINNELTENQAFIILAISKHETGKWTSRAFTEKNNLGGIMCSTGLKNYNSLDEGIDAFVSLLKNRYFDKGLDTIEKIQPVYCPIGADNDPRGLNQYWLPRVTEYYNEYTK